MNSKSLKFNTILNAFRMLLTVIVPLITFPYTSRVFLTDGSGQINFVTSVVSVFTLFASLGVYGYGIREGTKVRNDKVQFTKLAIELFIINVIATLITYVVFIILIKFYDGFSNYTRLFLINGVSIGFTALGLDWVYGTYEDYKYITLRQIAVQIFTIIAMFIFVHDESDIYIWMVVLTASAVIPNIFNFIHARHYFCRLKNIKLELKRHIQPIVILFATTVASKVYSSIDVFLLGVLATDHNTGLYSAAVKVNTILITLFAAMSPVFMPRIGEALKYNQREAYYELLKKIFRMILSLTIPAVVGLEMVSEKVIIVLAGPAFADAAITMRILAPIVLITSCSNVLYYDVLVPNGKEACVLKCTVIAAIINLIISFILIPSSVQNGAAVGSLVSELIAFILAIAFCLKQDKNFGKTIPNIRNYLIGSFFIIVSYVICNYFISNSVFCLLVTVTSSGIIYFVVLYIKKDIMSDEIMNFVNKYFYKIIRRED